MIRAESILKSVENIEVLLSSGQGSLNLHSGVQLELAVVEDKINVEGSLGNLLCSLNSELELSIAVVDNVGARGRPRGIGASLLFSWAVGSRRAVQNADSTTTSNEEALNFNN